MQVASFFKGIQGWEGGGGQSTEATQGRRPVHIAQLSVNSMTQAKLGQCHPHPRAHTCWVVGARLSHLCIPQGGVHCGQRAPVLGPTVGSPSHFIP